MKTCRRFLPLLLAALPTSTLWGDVITATYTGPDNGSYNVAANWDANVIPNNAGANSYNVIIDGNAARNVQVQQIGTVTINNLTINAGDSLALTNALALTIAGGSFVNNGSFQMLSSGNATDLYFATSTTASGSGTIIMNASANNRIYGANASLLTLSNAISGTGQIGVNLLCITNNATITATLPQGLTIDPYDGLTSFTNNGMVSANGGPLALLGGTFTGGTVDARNNSTLSLSAGAYVRQATLQTDGSSAAITMANATLGEITNNAKIMLTNGSFGYLRNSIVNHGVIAMQATNSTTDLIFSANTTLSGGGTITLSNSSVNRLYSNAASTLTNDNTITGAGQLGVNLLSLVNTGAIIASSPAGLSLDPADNGSGFTNMGTLRADGGPMALLAGSYTNGNSIIEAKNASTLTLTNNSYVVGGIVRTDANPNSRIIISNGYIRDLTFVGNVAITNSASAYPLGTITNNGIFTIDSQGNATDLNIGNVDVTFAGSGSLVLSSNSTLAANARVLGGGSRFTSNIPISGAGQIGVNTIKLANNSTITATVQPGITIDPNDAPDGFINNGTLGANGGPLTLAAGTFTNNGIVDARNTSDVSVVNSNIIGGSLTTDATSRILLFGSGITNLTIAGNVVTPNNNAGYLGGTLLVNGILKVDAQNNGTDLNIGNVDVTLSGTGSVVLSSNTTAYANGRIVGSTARLTTNIPISGVGQIGVNTIKFTNNSIITATAAPGLTIDPNDAVDGFLNNGTLRADGGVLTLTAGTFTNNTGTGGGILQARNASDFQIVNSAVIGGNLTTEGTGRILIYNSSLKNVTTSGTLVVVNNNTLYPVGTLTNNGLITLDCQGNGVDFHISNVDVTLAGSGTLVLSSSSTSSAPGRIIGSFARLTNNSTILGTGQLGVNTMKFTNNGTIAATAQPGMSIDPNDAADGFISTGTIRADSAPLSFAFGNYTLSGNLQAVNGGTLNFVTGNFAVTAPISLTNGNVLFGAESQAFATVSGSGTVTLPASHFLTSDGIATSILQVSGALTIRSNNGNSGVSRASTLTLAGSMDAWTGRIDLTNNALVLQTLGGSAKTNALATLQNQILTGKHGGDWTGAGITSSLIAANATTASPFLTMILADNADLHYTSYRGQALDDNAFIVAVCAAGDANLDGIVNAFDLNILAAHWQQQANATWYSGDFNADGKVDAFDLNALAATWQYGAGGSLAVAADGTVLQIQPPTSIPEPAAIALLGLGWAALLTRRRPRRLTP